MNGEQDEHDMETARGTSAERAALLIAVPSATLAFTLSFNLGAFDTIFFEAIFWVWVVSTVVLIGSLVSKLPPQHWGGRLILFVPTLWIVASWFIDPTDEKVAAIRLRNEHTGGLTPRVFVSSRRRRSWR